MRPAAFATYHPVLTFGFYVFAIVITVMAQNPLWIAASMFWAAVFYVCVQGRTAWKMLLPLALAFVVIAAINPLVNTRGETVLFYLGHQRPYTLEALLYGAQTAAMFVAVMIWFGSYNKIMTSDKFTYLFGAMAPSIVLVLTMILRLVPSYIRKAKQIATSRSCIGLSGKQGSMKKRAEDSVAILSALTSWALEASIITADSMRSRGFGSLRSEGKKRTQFANYKLTLRDLLLFVFAAVMLAILWAALATGAADIEFLPTVTMAPVTAISIVGLVAYSLFLALPTIVEIRERILWRSSLLKI